MTIDKAFEAFKTNPSPENAWLLQQAMVDYARTETPKAITKVKSVKAPKAIALKTSKGKIRDKELQAIADVFIAQGCSIEYGSKNEYVEAWVLTDKDGNRARLYLGADLWSMGTNNGTKLKGVFEDYDDKEVFQSMLDANGIEIDE